MELIQMYYVDHSIIIGNKKYAAGAMFVLKALTKNWGLVDP